MSLHYEDEIDHATAEERRPWKRRHVCTDAYCCGDIPDPPQGPDKCPGCLHEFDPPERAANRETGRCVVCDPHYCYRCGNVTVHDPDRPCAACAPTTCEQCEDETRHPGLDVCRGCAEVQADSLAVDLQWIGEDLARAEALVARLTEEAEATRRLRQGILDALEGKDVHAA